MLEKLKELTAKKGIKIVGHKNPDFDSIASGIILERFLCLNEIDAPFLATASIVHFAVDKYRTMIEGSPVSETVFSLTSITVPLTSG